MTLIFSTVIEETAIMAKNAKFADIKTPDLQAARDTAFAAFSEAIQNESPTPEQVEEAAALEASVDEHDAELAERAAEVKAAAEKFAAMKSRKFGAEGADGGESTEGGDEGGDDADADADTDADADADADAAPAVNVEKAEEVKAAAKTVKTLAAKTKRPAVPAERDTKAQVSIVAAAETGFAAGHVLSFAEMGQAAIARLRGMPAPDGDGNTTQESLKRFPAAAIEIPFSSDAVIDERTSDAEALEIIARVSDEFQIKDRNGVQQESLVAANGWCAPSETLYDLASDESLDGILSLPEVQINRGGIRYTVGPQFADFYANAGFVQTETQAIAGTTKPCYEVTCPTFTEVRLDAVGVCIKVPILLNAAYPEMVNRFTSGTLIAHQHMVNLNVINRMVALSTVRDATAGGLGSVASDTIEVLELVINQRRQSQRLSFDRTVEVAVPFWLKGALRADLSRRTGVGSNAITDADIAAHFAVIHANVQFVYDWQPLPATATDLAYPATFKALVYPAGTFIKGVSSVINLSAVYDAASLAVNTYTGLFMEQGLLVAKKQYGSDLVTLPICTAGRTGAADLVCA